MKVCKLCRLTFPPGHGNRLFCSERCRAKASYAARRSRLRPVERAATSILRTGRTCADCGVGIEGKHRNSDRCGLCQHERRNARRRVRMKERRAQGEVIPHPPRKKPAKTGPPAEILASAERRRQILVEIALR